MDKSFWDSFFGRAKEMGFRPRNVILVILAAFTYLAMGSGGVDTTDAILAFVIFYGLDPLIDSIRSWFSKRNALNKRGVVEDEFKRFLKTKRKELKSNQPELPFPPLEEPRSDRHDHQ